MGESHFQQTAKLLQERWRVEQGYPPGGNPWWLAMPNAEEHLWNFLTPGIGALVRAEYDRNGFVRDSRSRKLYRHPRLFDNLLSSQPMCFNLFGELALDVELATLVLRDLFPGRVDQVTEIRFEHSPGRGDARYLGNRSAFDAFVVHTTPVGGLGFIGIETKYHENMSASPGDWNTRYDQVATEASAWKSSRPEEQELVQIALDHLLALSMTQAADGWETGLFAFVYPQPNVPCRGAAGDYRAVLNERAASTFAALTVEQIIDAIGSHCRQPWVDDFRYRYLDWSTFAPS